MRGFDHATILSPSFHGLRKEGPAQRPPLLCHKYDEKRVADLASETNKSDGIQNHCSY